MAISRELEEDNVLNLTSSLNEKQKLMDLINHVNTHFSIKEIQVIDTLTQATARLKFEHNAHMKFIKWMISSSDDVAEFISKAKKVTMM
ncbi:unnamed protein product [Adineta steineri]|uniref:Uncharacterized protein n=1 Tax=Adineta steineri TaxID=433720 RepID=A0A819BVU9_9BILA|nr:unnamed protein product [Adineta steineri]CAF1486020.1 unnamed protein product [Adineta steineri]CAF3808565.1 unnamed protein product [Adineta steineri]CAF3845496.1 unnamed protein product [Adineta steineri]